MRRNYYSGTLKTCEIIKTKLTIKCDYMEIITNAFIQSHYFCQCS